MTALSGSCWWRLPTCNDLRPVSGAAQPAQAGCSGDDELWPRSRLSVSLSGTARAGSTASKGMAGRRLGAKVCRPDRAHPCAVRSPDDARTRPARVAGRARRRGLSVPLHDRHVQGSGGSQNPTRLAHVAPVPLQSSRSGCGGSSSPPGTLPSSPSLGVSISSPAISWLNPRHEHPFLGVCRPYARRVPSAILVGFHLRYALGRAQNDCYPLAGHRSSSRPETEPSKTF